MDSSIANDVRNINEQMYDAACKRLFSEKEILAWIMQLAVDEFRGLSPKEIIPYIEGTPEVASVAIMPDTTSAGQIRGEKNEDVSPTEGSVYYDIHFRATVPGTDGQIELILNVEAQNQSDPGYPLMKRAIYYCARLLSSQKNVDFKGSEYGKLKKVYSIWIVNHPPKKAENTVTEYRIEEICKIGNTKVWRGDYDMLRVVFLYLGNHREVEEINALKLLDVIKAGNLTETEQRNIIENDFAIEMTERMDEEVSEMCNWSQGVKEDGRKEGLLEVIRNMLANGISFDTAIKMAGIQSQEDLDYLRQNLSV